MGDFVEHEGVGGGFFRIDDEGLGGVEVSEREEVGIVGVGAGGAESEEVAAVGFGGEPAADFVDVWAAADEGESGDGMAGDGGGVAGEVVMIGVLGEEEEKAEGEGAHGGIVTSYDNRR